MKTNAPAALSAQDGHRGTSAVGKKGRWKGLALGMVGAATLAGASLPPGVARAQSATFALDHFDPSERGSEWFSADSLDFRGELRPSVGLVGSWAFRPLVFKNANGDVAHSIVRHQAVTHAGVSLVFLDRFRLAVDLPVQVWAKGTTTIVDGATFTAPSKDVAIGDIRISAAARLLGVYGDPFTTALGVTVFAPTGKEEDYLSDGKVRVAPHLMIAGDVGFFTYAAKGGFNIRSQREFARATIGSDVFYDVAAGARVADGALVIGPELVGSSVIVDSRFAHERSSPVELILGAHYTTPIGLRIGAGWGAGLNAGFGAPASRGLFTLEWTSPPPVLDRDRDGVPDAEDACPDIAGVPSSQPAQNGCPPPPPDADGDGIIDAKDACKLVPGVASADPAQNGCPLPKDSDGDGIIDPKDACPKEAGPANEDPKKNGCPPPPDTDKDGIIDAKDACPEVAGLPSEDPKLNGCPDPDRDKDGVLNDSDACPDIAGQADPDPKRNGCPKAYVKQGQIKILDQVKFKTNSAAIMKGKDSEEVLNAVKQVLDEHPEIAKVRVEGHTDSKGKAAKNRKLSAARAASVVKWLVSHGVAASKLSSQGFGPDRPIDSNATEEGRRNNRRVEFHIEGAGQEL